jgi:hypothetical protein
VVRADGQHSEWFWRREFQEAYRWLQGSGPSFIKDDLEKAASPYRWGAFPNPCRDTFRITKHSGLHHHQPVILNDSEGPSAGSYKLYSIMGELVKYGHFTQDDLIDIHELTKSIYILEVYDGRNYQTFPLSVL